MRLLHWMDWAPAPGTGRDAASPQPSTPRYSARPRRGRRARLPAVLLLLAPLPALSLTLAPQLGGAPGPVPLRQAAPAALSLQGDADLGRHLTSELVISSALALVGTDYRLGGDGVEAIDCSALVQRVFRSAGFELPRTTREQLQEGRAVPLHALRKGDLLFYRWRPRQLHVAVYVDEDTIIHASPKRGEVVLTRLTPVWRARLVAARRLF